MFGENLKLIHYFNKEVRGTAVTVLQILRDIVIQGQQEERFADQQWSVGMEKKYSAIVLDRVFERDRRMEKSKLSWKE